LQNLKVFSFLCPGANRGGAAAWWLQSLATRRPTSSGEARNGKRRSMRSQGCAHLRRRRTGVAGFRRGAAGGGALGAAGLHARTVLRWSSGDGERRGRFSSTSWSSWWCWLGSKVDGSGESRAAAHRPARLGSVLCGARWARCRRRS
jgi:hypothetical protein